MRDLKKDLHEPALTSNNGASIRLEKGPKLRKSCPNYVRIQTSLICSADNSRPHQGQPFDGRPGPAHVHFGTGTSTLAIAL
jgi:hypothetical protein